MWWLPEGSGVGGIVKGKRGQICGERRFDGGAGHTVQYADEVS